MPSREGAMSKAEQKSALEGILIMLMHTGEITICADGSKITADFSNLAKTKIIATNKDFCDLPSFAESALQQLSNDGGIVSDLCAYFAVNNSGPRLLFPYSVIAVSIISAMNAAVFEDAVSDIFTREEMQSLLRKHPDFDALDHQDKIDNPETTDHYNAGELGFTC